MEKAMLLVLAVIAVVAALAPPQAEAVISCNTVATDLNPCFDFVLSTGNAPPSFNCCSAIRSLSNQLTTTADRQAVCRCLMSVARAATPTMINNADALPGKCGVNNPYKINPYIDCSTIR